MKCIICACWSSHTHANYVNLEASRGFRGWHFFDVLFMLLCVANFDGHVQSQHTVTFPLGLWYVWPHVECEYKYGATCSLNIWYVGPLFTSSKHTCSLEFFPCTSRSRHPNWNIGFVHLLDTLFDSSKCCHLKPHKISQATLATYELNIVVRPTTLNIVFSVITSICLNRF